MKLRAHHLLCTRAFKGYGYSPQFIKNMYNIISLIKTEKNISLITRCDAICTECPKNKDECCILEDKVLEFDMKTLKYLNLEQKKYSYTEIEQKLNNELTPEVYSNICSGCEWFKCGICSYDDVSCPLQINK